MVEYHPTWSEDELAAILHRLSEAGGGEARFGQDENGAVTGVDNPQELERALFNVGYAQRPRIIAQTRTVLAPNGKKAVIAEVGEFTIRDMPSFVP